MVVPVDSAVANLAYIATRNIEVTPNPMQFEINFGKDVGQPEGSYLYIGNRPRLLLCNRRNRKHRRREWTENHGGFRGK